MVSRIIYGIILVLIGILVTAIIDVILHKVLKNFKKDKSILIFFYIRVMIDGLLMFCTYQYSFVLLGVTIGLLIERAVYIGYILYRQKIEKRCIS